jgi:hypothetical protein
MIAIEQIVIVRVATFFFGRPRDIRVEGKHTAYTGAFYMRVLQAQMRVNCKTSLKLIIDHPDG